MKKWLFISVLLVSLSLISIACSPLGSTAETTERQLAQVARGDLTTSVTGSGNVEISREVKLSFGSGGKLDSVPVQVGDTVKKGDILAKLDTSALELAGNQGQLALTQAQTALVQAQLSQQTAEYNLKNTQDTKETLELALFKAQIDARLAKYNLDKAQETYKWPDVEVTQADLDKAEAFLQYAIDGAQNATDPNDLTIWNIALARAQAQVDALQAKLKAQLVGYDTEEVAIKKMQMEAAQKAEAQADKSLKDLTDDIAIKDSQVKSAKETVSQAQQSVEFARQSLAQAQKQLDEATITAPFDGTVASVGVKEGESVSSLGTVIQLIDPGILELVVEVDEIDMPKVKLEQEAVISIDALPDSQFKGAVAAIYPLPNVEGGVVLYNVKIKFSVPQDSGIRVGMSASADVTTDKRSNVLLVPTRAIKRDSQGNQTVQVMNGGQTQEKLVTIGASDDTRTEITSGLYEGETVVVETKVKSTPAGGLFGG